MAGPAPRRATRGGLLGATSLAALVGWGVLTFTAPAVAQLPTGGTVVGGAATITTGTNQVVVNQTTNRGVIDWRSFSIGQGNRVDFQQPGASSVTLNRVTGPDPSVIAGQLTANGQIVLVNGAGVVFANGAQVNVGSLAASTANIRNPQAFMADGKLVFDVPSPNANAGVVNAGTITVRDGGLVGLVGNMAANHGVINARLGRVTIGGAETFTVDLAGDGLINFQIGQPVTRQPVDGQGKKQPLASNTGTINADGGVVTLTARAAGGVVDNVVNVGGAIRAQAVSQEGGVLVLGGEDGGTVNITGKLDVSGKSLGQRGGQVIATAAGGKVNVASSAVIDASGASGGGRVNIGGNYQGKGPLPNARDTKVEAGARITADATMMGNGGSVIVWADNATVFGGTISARGGGLKGGNGGFVEVSGKNYLDYRGSTDVRAPYGITGTLLLDPADILIQNAGPDNTEATGGDPNTITGKSSLSILTVGTLQAALETANVVVDSTVGTGDGSSISVIDPVSIPGGRTLTLLSSGSVSIGAAITTPGDANLTISALGVSGTGSISLGNGALTLTTSGNIDLSGAAVKAGVVNFTASGGSVSLTNENNAIGVVAAAPSSAGGFFGDVNIFNGSSLTIGSGGITTTGPITIRATGQLLVNGDVRSTGTSGSLFIQASGAIGGVGIQLTAGTLSAPTVTLTADDGDIAQTVGSSIISSGTLGVTATAGGVQLTSPTNDVNAIFGSAATNFRYVDANAVVLGEVVLPGTSSFFVRGISVGAGGYVDIAANAFSIAAETVFVPYEAARIGEITGSGADNPTGATVLRSTAAGTPMVIGGLGSGPGLTEIALRGGIRTGSLRIGSIGRAAGTTLGGASTAGESAAGSLTIQGLNLFGSAVGTLVLESGAGSITQTDSLFVNALATGVTGGGSVTLTSGNGAGTIAHIARISDTTLGTQTGAYQYVGVFTVTAASVGTEATPLVGLRDSGTTPGLPANAAIVTSGGNVSLTSLSSDTVNINNALVAIGAVVTLSDPTGPINNSANGSIDVGSGGTLNLNAGGSINLGAAPITAGVVNFVSGGSVTLNNLNNVIGAVANTASKAGALFGNINIFSKSALTIGPGGMSAGFITIGSAEQVLVAGNITSTSTSSTLLITSTGAIDGIGILQTGGTISAPLIELSATAGDIVQRAGNIVATGAPGFQVSLTANASGSVDLSSATNDVVSLVGAAGGDFRYVDANTLSIGQVSTFTIGITIGAGRYVDIAADGITITANARIGGIANPFGPGAGAPADNPNGVTVLRPATANAAMVIGGTGAAGNLYTEAQLLNSIRTGTLRIGSIGRAVGTVLGGAATAAENAAGAITIQGLDFTSGSVVQTLVLESGATGTAIGQTAAVKVNHLATAVVGSGSVELTNPDNSVAGLAHIARVGDTQLGTQSGTYRYVDGSSIPVIRVAGAGARLVGARDSGDTAGMPPNSAIVTNGGDVTLVSRTGSIEFIDGLAAIGATARLSAADQIFQSATGGVVANSLLAVAGGSVDLTTAAGLNDVRFLSGSAAGSFGPLGDFRLINNASVTVSAGGVAGDSLVAGVDGVHAGPGATLELAIRTGDITVNNTTLTTVDGLVLLRRVAGATGSEIILNNVSFDSGSGSPNLVVLDLTGSPAMAPGNFAALKSSSTPPSGTSAIPIGPNPDGGILLTNVNAGNTTVYLVGGAGSTISGSGTYGLLGVYVAHSNPIALTGSVRQIDPTSSHSVTAPFSEPFDSTTFAGFYVRRRGEVVDLQTFNTCVIGTGLCPVPPPPETDEPHIPTSVTRQPDNTASLVGAPDLLVINIVTDISTPTPLGLSTVILVNQGNENFFNVDDDQRKQRAARGGQ
ncbi:filamentous hemagglutinin N-terminal domain-containing protein [Reyranella sp. CPCC 100927]|uniref:beta strand repeat-containing protein n=1 Tax=Reyranella sp. CPCC 100927 TaxID=2599616 RepID=UPI0015B6632A|nr:filamentous hemagglutinin N-terminal domain-containing protein [Reyranella sp. CPCC 100927]